MAEHQKTQKKQTRPKVEQAKKPERRLSPHFKTEQLVEAPETMRLEQILAAQQHLGNQVVQRALDKNTHSLGPIDGQGNLREDLARQIQQKRGGGSPLPDFVKKDAVQKLGSRFGDVRIHTDETADRLNRAIHARAFTLGRDIFFKQGAFAPSTSSGRETLLHELTHVVQQGGKSFAGALKLGAPDTAQEKEARKIGQQSSGKLAIRQAAPANAVHAVQQETPLDDLQELSTTAPVNITAGIADQAVNWTTGSPDTDNVVSGQAAMGIGAPKALLDIAGIGFGARSLYAARQRRNAPDKEGEVGSEAGWKQEKGATKDVGAGLVNLSADTLGTVGGGMSAAGNAVGQTVSSVGGGFGVAASGVELGRNLWGMGRAAHKARQLGGWTGKGGIVEELGKAQQDTSKTDEEKADVGKLQEVAKFAHKTKSRTAGIKALGAVGAGLGVAGGALALASNPVGWGIAGAGAAIGLGIGGYKMGRGLWKRSHRRDKLAAAESALGMAPYQGQGSAIRRAWNWARGADIDERREALEKRKAEMEAAASGSDPAAKTANINLLALAATKDKSGKGDVFERAMHTEKERMAHSLVGQIKKDSAPTSFAQRIGQTLGVTSQEGKVVQSRGWNIFKQKPDLDVGKVDTDEKKHALEELFMRKMGSSS